MKSLKSRLLIAALSLCTLLVPSAFSNAVAPIKGIDVIVRKCPTCRPPQTVRQQHTTVSADGTANVKLTEPGSYTIEYASGLMRGKVLWSGEVKKAQLVSCKIDKAYLNTNVKGNSQ